MTMPLGVASRGVATYIGVDDDVPGVEGIVPRSNAPSRTSAPQGKRSTGTPASKMMDERVVIRLARDGAARARARTTTTTRAGATRGILSLAPVGMRAGTPTTRVVVFHRARATTRSAPRRVVARACTARACTARALASGLALAQQTLLALGARAIEDAVNVAATPSAYAPSPYAAEDGLAQLFVCAFILVVGGVGMKVSLEGETEARETALADKVRAQTTAMSGATSTTMEAVRGEEDAGAVGAAVMARGVVRVNDVLSEEASAEMLRYVDETLRANDAGGKNLSMETFGNVYCKKNRWDLKLAYDAPVRKALGECVKSMREVLRTTCGEDAELVELAALVSDPGSTRQPVHPDTAYRRDPSVFTCFVALQDVERDMGPTLFIPGTNNAQAHVEFREGQERGGPVLQRPYELGVISRGDATLFDSRTLHCGTENESARRRVLFYFSFQRSASENPNAAISTIRTELRGKYTLADLLP